MTEPTRLPRSLRRRAATERVVGWSWPPAPVLDARRCWCGRPIPDDSISACGCCCTEHDDPPARPARLPEHLRTDDINDYLRQKGEIE